VGSEAQPEADTGTAAEPQAAGGVKEEATVTEEGVVRAATDEEIILVRDNGSDIRIRYDKSSLTKPSEGDRIQVVYRFDGPTSPIAVSIKER
jgi:hypothetical protein